MSSLDVSSDHPAVKREAAEALLSTVMGESVKRSRADFGECDVRDNSNCVVFGQASGVPRSLVFRRRWSCKAVRAFPALKSEEGGGRCLSVGIASGSSSVDIASIQCSGSSNLHAGSMDGQLTAVCSAHGGDCTSLPSLVPAVHDLDSLADSAVCLDNDCLRKVRDRSVGICGVGACSDASREGSLSVSSHAYESPEPLYMGADENHRHLMHFSEDSGT